MCDEKKDDFHLNNLSGFPVQVTGSYVFNPGQQGFTLITDPGNIFQALSVRHILHPGKNHCIF
jgi:hypothetical protein